MLNELFVTIAAGVISVLPVQPAPAVVVTASDIESSVTREISGAEERKVAVDCGFSFKELSLQEDDKHRFHCTTTDETNKQEFSTVVDVKTKKEKVVISVVVVASQSETEKLSKAATTGEGK